MIYCVKTWGCAKCPIGYEPAELTVRPPPPKKNDRGWVHFFRIGV